MNFTKGKLAKIYNSGRSLPETAEVFGCSPNKVKYWMEKYKIKRRSQSEAGYIKHNPNGDPFKIKINLSKDESFLKGLGLGIYWGEGNKVTPTSLRVSNTDPALLRAFIIFLQNICQLDKKRISYSLICFNDSSPEKVRGYWAHQLKILPKKFGKITQIPTQGKGTYKRKSQFGVCTVQGNNVKLKTWIINELFELDKNLPG